MRKRSTACNIIRVPGFDAPRSMLLYRAMDAVYAWRVRRRLPPADIVVTNTIFLPVMIRDPRLGKLYVHVARFPKGRCGCTNMPPGCKPSPARWPTRSARNARLRVGQGQGNSVPSEQSPAATRRGGTGCSASTPHSLSRANPSRKGIGYLAACVRAVSGKRSGAVQGMAPAAGRSRGRAPGRGWTRITKRNSTPCARRSATAWNGSAFVSGDELVRQYREASVFVYPSVAEKGETFGLAPLEAMALGCATVVSGLECFRDFLVHGETGLMFDHRGTERPEEALCAQLQRLAGDDELRARLARRGYEVARQFTRERVAALYLEDFRIAAQRLTRTLHHVRTDAHPHAGDPVRFALDVGASKWACCSGNGPGTCCARGHPNR